MEALEDRLNFLLFHLSLPLDERRMDQLLHETDKNRQMANQIIRQLFRHQDCEQRTFNAKACVSWNHHTLLIYSSSWEIVSLARSECWGKCHCKSGFSFVLENISAEKYVFAPREVICHPLGKTFFSLFSDVYHSVFSRLFQSRCFKRSNRQQQPQQ